VLNQREAKAGSFIDDEARLDNPRASALPELWQRSVGNRTPTPTVIEIGPVVLL
jgi:hypothetical protein